MMDFSFDADQLALRDGLRDALKDLDGRDGPADPAAVWSRLEGLGLTSPAELGLDDLDLVLCLEETGRAVLPVPVVETLVVVRHLVPDAGRASLVLDGSSLLPWPDQGLAFVGDAAAGVVARPPREGLTPDAGGQPFTGGDRAVPAVDPHRPLARVSPGEPLDVAPEALAAAWRAGALGTAAQLIGLGSRAVELTVEYVKERQQFGVAVGSFQAVKHQLADATLAIELARPLVYAAAWAQATDAPTAERDVAAAKLRAGQAAGRAARAALQCHGAMGYTQEYPLHRWLTRIWALRAAWGTEARHRSVLARELGLEGRTDG